MRTFLFIIFSFVASSVASKDFKAVYADILTDLHKRAVMEKEISDEDSIYYDYMYENDSDTTRTGKYGNVRAIHAFPDKDGTLYVLFRPEYVKGLYAFMVSPASVNAETKTACMAPYIVYYYRIERNGNFKRIKVLKSVI